MHQYRAEDLQWCRSPQSSEAGSGGLNQHAVTLAAEDLPRFQPYLESAPSRLPLRDIIKSTLHRLALNSKSPPKCDRWDSKAVAVVQLVCCTTMPFSTRLSGLSRGNGAETEANLMVLSHSLAQVAPFSDTHWQWKPELILALESRHKHHAVLPLHNAWLAR